jgi:ribosome biogenesis GTPase A
LDTPGILWPKFDDQIVGLRLALIGSMKDENVDRTEMAIELITFLQDRYPGLLKNRYDVEESKDRVAVLEEIAANRNCLAKGGSYDLEKASILLLDEFRSGKIGHITLEFPE